MWWVSESVLKSTCQRCVVKQLSRIHSRVLIVFPPRLSSLELLTDAACWLIGTRNSKTLLVGEQSENWAAAWKPYGDLHMERSEIQISEHIRAALRTMPGGREKPSPGMLLGDALILMLSFLRMSALSAFLWEKLKDISISLMLLLALLKLESRFLIVFCRRAWVLPSQIGGVDISAPL